MGAVDLVVQIEAPPSVAAGLQRIGRAGHQVGAVSRGVVFPKHRGDLVSCAVVAERMSDGRDRGAAVSAQPARRAGPADRRDGGAGRLAGRRPGRPGPPGRAVRRAARLGPARRARHAVRALPVDRVRRAAAPAGLGPHHRRADRPARRPAARRHQRRHDPRPRHVRRLPGRLGAGVAGRRAGRGDGLRVPGRRRLPARLDLLADRGHHARPGAGLPRAGRAGPDAVLEGRRARPPGRAGPGDRRPAAHADPGRRRRRDRRAARVRAGRVGGRQPGGLPARAARGDPQPAGRPDRAWSSGSATSSATGG